MNDSSFGTAVLASIGVAVMLGMIAVPIGYTGGIIATLLVLGFIADMRGAR